MKKIIIKRVKSDGELNKIEPYKYGSIIPLIEQNINQYIDIHLKTNHLIKNNNDKFEGIHVNLNSYNFPLTNLLAKHKIFQKSEKNFLPKTDILDEYILRLNEPERKNLITYSLINNKIYQAYLEILKILQPVIELSLYYKEKNRNPIFQQEKIDYNEMIQYLIKNITTLNAICETFIKNVPGLNDLPIEYIAKIIKRNSIDVFFLTYDRLYQDGEFYLFFEKGHQMSRSNLNKIRGQKHTDLLFEAFEMIENLKITERERGIFLSYIFSLPMDENDSVKIAKVDESLEILNEFFKGALLYEFDLSKRAREFILKFETLAKSLQTNREIQYKNNDNT